MKTRPGAVAAAAIFLVVFVLFDVGPAVQRQRKPNAESSSTADEKADPGSLDFQRIVHQVDSKPFPLADISRARSANVHFNTEAVRKTVNPARPPNLVRLAGEYFSSPPSESWIANSNLWTSRPAPVPWTFKPSINASLAHRTQSTADFKCVVLETETTRSPITRDLTLPSRVYSHVAGRASSTAQLFVDNTSKWRTIRMAGQFHTIEAKGLWPARIAPESGSPIFELLAMQQRIEKFAPEIQKAIVSVEGGSGFIASPGGVVITVAHVTREAGRRVIVQLSDGTQLKGTTLGSNNSTDLGAVQLDGPGPWPSLEMADPGSLKPGDWCVAMGYPITFSRDKPAAIRTGRVLETSGNKIVTDCVIMGGDSGGPLLDTYGKVLGINIGVTTDVSRNIHMPADRFMDDARTILAGIDMTPDNLRPTAWLGVRGVTDVNTVRIRSVNEGSPAAQAGLRSDDVILGIDGTKVESFSQMVGIIREHNRGDVIVAQLNRFGTVFEVAIRLDQR